MKTHIQPRNTSESNIIMTLQKEEANLFEHGYMKC
jgi:hypothetical protein